MIKRYRDTSRIVEVNEDSRIHARFQINLFGTTNTFCYGINKQDIQYNLQDKLKLLIITNNQN